MSSPQRPILDYHGGKWRVAPWIIQHFAPHKFYTEAYGGAGSVLMRKPKVKHECYNDLSGQVVNVMRVVRERGEELAAALRATPFAEEEFELSYEPCDDALEMARRTVMRAFMSHSSASVTRKGKSGFRWKGLSKPCPFPRSWASYPAHIKSFAERLSGVTISKRSALEVLREWDRPETLHYLDPPYVNESRNTGSDCYEYEMNEEDHATLIEVASSLDGMVLISGYDSPLYSGLLNGWHKKEKNAIASSNKGAITRKECLWMNEQLHRQRQARTLFN